MTHYKLTTFGFEYGAAEVQRYCSDIKKGWVEIGIIAGKNEVTIYVTRTGKIRVFKSRRSKIKTGTMTRRIGEMFVSEVRPVRRKGK